ncbi:MAG TPA: sigma-70 family RNA polymerase sigma factor [Methylomirabilota bacterium]|nr:sigma-70 family RNA polymerase sigma factor [Methylomirabilota bacterium]
MRVHLTYKNLEREPLEPLLQQLAARLEARVADFPQDAVLLHGTLEKHPSRALYCAALVLRLPRRTLTAQEEHTSAQKTVEKAFVEIERQLKKYKALLRREHLWKRPARREAIRLATKLAAAPLQEAERALFRDLILANLKKLYNFIRREMAYYLTTGELLPGELQIEDVVDGVVLQAAQEFSQRPANLEVSRWLLKLALNYMEAKIRRLKEERAAMVSVEEDIPEPLDELYEFYQPDEDLRLEDVLPDPLAPTPEQVLESRDLQRYINHTLAQLPRPWRNAFVFYYMEGLSLPEVALVTGQTEVEAQHYLEYAREFLRQKIVESDLAMAA